MVKSGVSVKIKECFDKLGPKPSKLKVTKLLDKSFKEDGIRFLKIESSAGPDIDDIQVYGYFCPDRPKDKIVIVLSFNKDKRPIYDDNIAFNIEVVIEHEKVHLQQENKRNGFVLREKQYKILNPVEDQNRENLRLYLSDTDEIDAYAKQIVLEIEYHTGILTLRQLFDKIDVSNLWGLYQTVGVNTQVKRRLIRKICKWHQQLH